MSYYRPSPTRFVWGAAILLAIIAALAIGHTARVNSAYRAGKVDARRDATFDSAMVARLATVAALRTRQTDTVTRTVIQTRTRVDSLVIAIPESIRVLPPVDTLVGTVRVLTTQVDTLVATQARERTAWQQLARVDSHAIDGLRVESSARRDTITDLAKRPSRKTAALLTFLGALVGAVVSR